MLLQRADVLTKDAVADFAVRAHVGLAVLLALGLSAAEPPVTAWVKKDKINEDTALFFASPKGSCWAEAGASTQLSEA